MPEIKTAPRRGNSERIQTPKLILLSRRITEYKQEHRLLDEKSDLYHYRISPLLALLPCTDMGNAMRFTARYSEVIHYIPECGAWYVWTGKQWKEDTQGYVMEMVQKMLAYISIEASLVPIPTDESGNPLMYPQVAEGDNPTPEQRAIIEQFLERDQRVKELRKWAIVTQSKRAIDAMLGLVQQQMGVVVSILDFDHDPHLVNFLNGTLNTQTWELQTHNPLDLISKIAGCDYDPPAISPYWDRFMNKVTRGDDETLRTIKQISGQGLIGKQLDDVFPINFGPGSNGKTVYSEVLKEVLGDYADTAPSDLFLAKQNEGISNDRAALVGVRFLTVSETDEGRRLNEALVKGLTGGDTQKVRFLRQEFFPMTPVFTGMLFTNHKPIITGTDNGIWRRVKMIPWLHNFELDPEREDKPVVREKMHAELSGILNWLVRGYQDRLASGKLYVSPRIQEETGSYRYNSDTLGEFLEDYCIVTEEQASIVKKDLYEKYKEFALASGQDKITTDKGLGMKLRERSDIPFLSEKKIHGARYWTGIRLRTEYDPPHEATKQPQETPLPEQTEPIDQQPQTNEPPPQDTVHVQFIDEPLPQDDVWIPSGDVPSYEITDPEVFERLLRGD